LPPPSEMRRGLAPQCNHAWTPILAAAIQKRDVRVAQGGTRPAYCTVGMILPDVITPTPPHACFTRPTPPQKRRPTPQKTSQELRTS